MPYQQYLTSASTSSYASRTFSSSQSSPALATLTSSTFSAEAGCGPFGAYGIISYSSTTAVGYSSGGGQQAEGGLYSYSRIGTGSTAAFNSFNLVWAPATNPLCTGGEVPADTSGLVSGNSGATDSESVITIFGDGAITISGDYLIDNTNQDGRASQKTAYSFTASWNATSSQFDGSGEVSYTDFYSNSDTVVNNTDTAPYNPSLPAYFGNYKTETTTLQVALRKTTEEIATFYGPLEDSEATYTRIVYTDTQTTLSSIKTINQDSKVYWDVQGLSQSFKIEWIGYSSGGDQNLGLVYTGTAVSKDISEYAKILMETDSFSSSNQRNVFSFGSAFTNENFQDSYTLTYDIITTSEVASQTTTLERASIGIINSFLYGFIKTNTANATIYTAGTSTESVELVSSSQRFIYTYDTSVVAVSGASYSEVQAISTTSNFTKFVELSGLNKATSFVVRSFVTTTAPYTYRTNVYGITVDAGGNPDGRAYSFAPIFPQSALVIRSPESTNPDTFYTEKASVASFAEPSYSTAYKNYSPADCSLVLLALVALNTEGSWGWADGSQYPSWISVYDGTFAGDRASTSNQSVTVSQSSSYVGTGATNVYQTITYFIENNPNSQTTRTKSVAMALANSASSVSRLARTAVENLDSAYINSYLPSIPLNASDVFFTQGLQGNASYNMDKLLLNAYTTAKSTFAGSATSSFPISVSNMPFNIYRNKIRIDSAYDAVDYNSFNRGLLRY